MESLRRLVVGALAAVTFSAGAVACGGAAEEAGPARTSTASTQGLGAPCTNGACGDGQTCKTTAAAGGSTTTCEIACEGDAQCPEGTTCNLPPIVPDSIPNVCVR